MTLFPLYYYIGLFQADLPTLVFDKLASDEQLFSLEWPHNNVAE